MLDSVMSGRFGDDLFAALPKASKSLCARENVEQRYSRARGRACRQFAPSAWETGPEMDPADR